MKAEQNKTNKVGLAEFLPRLHGTWISTFINATPVNQYEVEFSRKEYIFF